MNNMVSFCSLNNNRRSSIDDCSKKHQQTIPLSSWLHSNMKSPDTIVDLEKLKPA